MQERICPRSPRETMDGWMYLPRYIDKIRLQVAGKLHSDYTENFGKGFDGEWLKAAGLTHDKMLQVVRNSVTDGEVCDWVHQNANRTPAEKAAHRDAVLGRPKAADVEGQARLAMRKQQAGGAHRDDIRTFVDCIDLDEHRL